MGCCDANVNAPPEQSYSSQMRDSLLAQWEAETGTGDFSELGPLSELEAKYRPAWERNELTSLANILGGVDGAEGLLGLYSNQVQPALSDIESTAVASRTASEQGLIDKYGAGITEKIRDAAGNKELISQIISEASGETDPALLSSLSAEANSAFGGQSVIGRDPNVLAQTVQGVGVDSPTVAAGMEVTVDPVTGQQVFAGPEMGYVQAGQQALQPTIDAGLLQAGQSEMSAGPSELDAALQSKAMERLGGGLTDSEIRNLQQGQRQSWAARGLANTLPAGVAEAFYVASRGEDRARQNEAMARQTAGELEARRQGRLARGAGMVGQAYGQALGAYQTDIGRGTGQQQMGLQAGMANQQTGLNAGLANQAAQLQAQGLGLSDAQARDLSRAQLGLQAGSTTADNLMRAQLANQQAGLTAQEANRQYGFNVNAANEANRFAQQQANRGFRGNVLGLQQQVLGGRYGRQLGAAQLGQATSADPFLALLGRPSQTMGQMQGFGGQAQGLAGSIGPKVFQPESQLASDIAMSNYGGNLAASTASGQNRAGMVSGLFQGLGSAICHVAREVYGEDNPQWIRFYVWKETTGPRWFKALYNKYSEQWAGFIKDKPRLKVIIRNWMNRQIGGK